MPWFTPTFQQAPPPPPKPAIIYHTAVQTSPLPKRVAVRKPVEAAQAATNVPSTMRVPTALRGVVYLDQRHQGTVRSALRMIAIQVHYRFVNDVRGSRIRVPSDAGLIWISGNPNNAPAINDLLALGRVVAGRRLMVQVNPNDRTITLMRDERAAG